MKIEQTVKTIKLTNPETLIMLKIGAFYHVYGKDSYILSYTFDYQIKQASPSTLTCGFPSTSLNKVLKRLEDLQINYKCFCKAENYELEYEANFKSDNEYTAQYEKAFKHIRLKNKINDIYQHLIDNIESPNIKEILDKIEGELFG